MAYCSLIIHQSIIISLDGWRRVATITTLIFQIKQNLISSFTTTIVGYDISQIHLHYKSFGHLTQIQENTSEPSRWAVPTCANWILIFIRMKGFLWPSGGHNRWCNGMQRLHPGRSVCQLPQQFRLIKIWYNNGRLPQWLPPGFHRSSTGGCKQTVQKPSANVWCLLTRVTWSWNTNRIKHTDWQWHQCVDASCLSRQTECL